MEQDVPNALKKIRRKPTMAQVADRHELYQRAVQAVDAEIDFVDATYRKLRGRLPRTLREDFCGTANTSCEFVRRRRTNRAWGVDLDHLTLEWGLLNNVAALPESARTRVELVRDDVMTARVPRTDCVLAMNFSYFLLMDRQALLRYFRHVHSGLAREGIFFLDAYGGYDAFRVLKEKRPLKGGVTYIWDQADFNPVDDRAVCHIHFAFKDGSKMEKAFTYEWRLWSLPEIRDVLADAGFKSSTIYWEGWDEESGEGDGDFQPALRGSPDPGWICYIVAEK
jgi:hypothetical protein